MKKYFKQIIKNPTITGSLMMIVGSNATNFINYIYHLLMGRLLGPSSYGELASLLSLVGLIGMVPAALSLVAVKYVSSAKNGQEINNLVAWINKKTLLAGIIILVVISLASPFLASFMKINSTGLIFIIAGTFLFSLPSLYYKSILQGLLRFKETVIGVLIENSTKLILGVLLVYIGFSVGGALTAFLMATFLGWLFSRYFLKDYLTSDSIGEIKVRSMVAYSVPVLVQSVAITSLYSTDLILVKHFFSPETAGLYAALSTLGKIIFFAVGPIGAVMFPMVSKRKAEGVDYKKVFNYSFITTAVVSFIILAVYWWVPRLAITILYGSLYLEIANLLVWFGVFITLFTLSSLLINFHLSLERTKVVFLPFLAAVFQFIGIWFYHSTLTDVILVSIVVNALLLFSLLIFHKIANDK